MTNTNSTAAQLAADLHAAGRDDIPAAFVDSLTENMLRPAVERFGDVDRAAAALTVLIGA